VGAQHSTRSKPRRTTRDETRDGASKTDHLSSGKAGLLEMGGAKRVADNVKCRVSLEDPFAGLHPARGGRITAPER